MVAEPRSFSAFDPPDLPWQLKRRCKRWLTPSLISSKKMGCSRSSSSSCSNSEPEHNPLEEGGKEENLKEVTRWKNS